MKLLAVCVGRPRGIEWRGERVLSSIWKSRVPGPVEVRETNLEGDEQPDLLVHGGVDKAVYAYPFEHYAHWRAELDLAELPFGAFGENLTCEGLSEAELSIGDLLRIGSAELRVTQPRIPCFKLAARFERADLVKRFKRSARSGFYLAVARQGVLAAGDPIELIAHAPESLTVALVARLYYGTEKDPELLRRAAELPGLPEDWRNDFRARVTWS